MTTQQDASIGFGLESTFKTGVTPDHFFEFLTEDFNWNPTFTDNNGMRVGRIVKAADRRVLTKEEANGSMELELMAKGMGYLFNAALGNATSTIVSGSAYQQVITPATTDYLPSYTVQVGVAPLGGGALNPQTYTGVLCDGFDLKSTNAAIPTCKFSFVGSTMSTGTALAAASYPASNFPWSFVQGSIVVGGTPTTPTSTALSSGGTAVADIREFDLSWKNNLDKNGFNYGGSGQRSRKPARGEVSLTGTLVAEYDNNNLRDAFRNQSDLAVVMTFQSSVAISGGNFPTLQIVLPDVRLNGEMPKPNKGDVITQSISFDGLDNRVAASSLYIAIVTAETAL